MPLGTKVGLSPGDCVKWGPSPRPHKGGGAPIIGPYLLWPNGWMDEDGTWLGGGPWFSPHCARWGQLPSPKKEAEPPSQFSAHLYCDQTAGCIKMPLGMEVGLSPLDFVLDGDQASLYPKRGGGPPNSRPTSIVAKRSRSRCHLVRR